VIYWFYLSGKPGCWQMIKSADYSAWPILRLAIS